MSLPLRQWLATSTYTRAPDLPTMAPLNDSHSPLSRQRTVAVMAAISGSLAGSLSSGLDPPTAVPGGVGLLGRGPAAVCSGPPREQALTAVSATTSHGTTKANASQRRQGCRSRGGLPAGYGCMADSCQE